MSIIRSITEKDFDRQETPEKWSTYNTRLGARAILLDESSQQIALMYVANHDYYKLPGGGVDDGEGLETALKRELIEEVGANLVDVISEVGQIDEYRDEWDMKSEHHCFLTKLTGPTVDPHRTDQELAHGYETVWAKGIDEAICLVKSGNPKEYGQDFERLRELTFLEYAKNSNLIS
ncbi:MAG TPA: NUDIX domain-containing protein [Candidatus Saccharibacteria bacterium]|nr:NUDIX domain-containing protein [Candidatus Saccharibacteria bacterium]HRQ06920.1 NUDIX domain-containing protein [Candidatus Saccharibacteria bacterium]